MGCLFVFCVFRFRQIRRVNKLSTITLNLLMTLCASNLVFIVGVQTSKNVFKCETIAVLLHYFHLSTAAWGLCHAFGIYNFVTNGVVPVMKYNNLLAYGASAVYVLVRMSKLQPFYSTKFTWYLNFLDLNNKRTISLYFPRFVLVFFRHIK